MGRFTVPHRRHIFIAEGGTFQCALAHESFAGFHNILTTTPETWLISEAAKVFLHVQAILYGCPYETPRTQWRTGSWIATIWILNRGLFDIPF